MKTTAKFATILSLLLALLVGGEAVSGQTRNERQIRDAVRSLNTKIDNFDYDLRYQMRTTSQNGGALGDVSADISTLKDEVRGFQQNLDRRRENREDINAIVDAARRIDEFLRLNPQNRRVEDDWTGVKQQIDRLASNYGVTPDWDNGSAPPVSDDRYDPNDPPRTYPTPDRQPNYPRPTITQSVGISGTYDLDVQRSDSVDELLSGSGTTGANRDELRDKLAAPGQIALDIRGNQVTLATTNASPMTFVADGREKTEPGNGGRTVRLRATLSGDKLVLSSLGGDTDYTITFTSVLNGRELKVSRRITTNYLNQTIFAESVYTKSDPVARLGIDTGNYGNGNNSGGYSDNDASGGQTNGGYGGQPTIGLPRTGEFVVPNGMVITGILENEINTKASQNNDRFRMTVQSPYEYRGATIDGYISGVGRSGKVTGRSNLTFNFERITLRDGRVYDFAGNLQSVRDQNGKEVKVDTEGQAKSDSQTKETAKRGGIGAGLGAVIGAIAGGAKGAVIGAVIGGGAGAGSVAIQGREDLQLGKGSTISVVSSSPIRSSTRTN